MKFDLSSFLLGALIFTLIFWGKVLQNIGFLH